MMLSEVAFWSNKTRSKLGSSVHTFLPAGCESAYVEQPRIGRVVFRPPGNPGPVGPTQRSNRLLQ